MIWAIWAHRAPALLLSLCCQAAAPLLLAGADGFHKIEVTPSSGEVKSGFTMMRAADTGLGFTNVLAGDAYLTNAVAHNGSGLALGDVDGDGWVDIYLCCLQGPNRLYRNLGQWRFQEMPLGAAACPEQLSTGATFADVDGDSDLDLLVNGIAAGTRLFSNDNGKFTEVRSGLSATGSPTSMALADIEGDGDLDLYCTHYIDVMHLADPTTRFAIMMKEGRWTVSKVNDQPASLPRWKDRFEVLPGGKVRELPEVDGFYRNDGRGRFTPIQFDPGLFLNAQGAAIPPYRDWGLAVMFRDVNGDRAPDLFVCNDNASPSRVWINTGKGTFRTIDPLSIRHLSRSAMGLDFADVNRDGLVDIFVADMLAREHEKRMTQLVRDHSDPQEIESIDGIPRYNRNMLFLGQADGSYAEAALLAGVAATDWSWCPIFLDVDLDGFEDLLVSNGFSFDVMDQDSHDQLRKARQSTREQLQRARRLHPAWPTTMAVFRNRRDGTFEPAAQKWGIDRVGIGNGMAVGDLDNDGDLDIVVNHLNAVATVLRNDATAGRIAVRLRGLPPNTQGIGAQIRIVGATLTQWQEMICGGRYMSGDEAMRAFALDASAGTRMRLDVTWRNGDQSTIDDIQSNRVYVVNQAGAQRHSDPPPRPRNEAYFADVTSLLGHVHVEAPFDDGLRQPLLPWPLSRLGPGVSWFDLNRDGWEDLTVTAGRGGRLAVYANEHGKAFRRLDNGLDSPGDQAAAVGWSDSTGAPHMVVALSNYELAPGQSSALWIYSKTNLATAQQQAAGSASLGPLSVADVDGDGDLDLFAGGRFIPGRYPQPASSSIWLNHRGELQLDKVWSAPFESLGLTSGATFADLDADGRPDLALALEWGPIRLFRNEGAGFREVTAEWSMTGTAGWWTSIVAGDFDADGRLDLAAGNWGHNTAYELYRPGTLRLFYGDWNQDGALDLLEAWQRGENWLPVRDHRTLTRVWPELAKRFTTHEAYGRATVRDLLGQHFETAAFLEATHLASSVFLNRGGRFLPVPLPLQAQMAPVFSINVADFDGDGIEDLFVAQNFFVTSSDISRSDSGRGLWLQGNGDGTFRPMDASVSGVAVYGEQRGAAVADFNQDGRIDLAVTQNRDQTRLFLNQRGKRGLRITLTGLDQNPQGIGAHMRVLYAQGRAGPCRIVQAGSGYWSQDSAVQVLGVGEEPVAIWVRWPTGDQQTLPLEKETWDIRIGFKQ